MSSEGVIECARDNFASSRTQNIDAIAYVTDTGRVDALIKKKKNKYQNVKISGEVILLQFI